MNIPTTFLQIQAGYLTLGLDSAGFVTGLVDSRNGRDYAAPGKAAPFVSLVIDEQQTMPTAVRVAHDGTYSFTNADLRWGFKVDIRVETHRGYATFEVINVLGPRIAADSVRTLLWGPLPTTISVGPAAPVGTIASAVGEAVGVVRDDAFAIGLKPLNARTEGGWPTDYPNHGWEADVAPNPYGQNVDSAMGQWSVAAQTSWGSILRAFTFDYTRQRLRLNANGYPIPVGPLESLGSTIGSKIALFGCGPELVTTILSFIASAENLPYPTLYGQWQKAAQASSQSTFVLNLTNDNVETAAPVAKRAGLDYLYALNTYRGPWQSTGHYAFDSSFGSGDDAAAKLVKRAESLGVHVGVHTMSDFIANNDPYIAPPDARLAKGGQAALSRPLQASDTELYLAAAWPVIQGLDLIPGGQPYDSVLLVGNELIGYFEKNVRIGTAESKVTGLVRGLWHSVAATASAGASVERVIPNGYNGAVGGLGIIAEIANRLGTIRNTVGIRSHSFDGLESASNSGWGSYGIARLVNGTYAAWAHHDGYISETSRMTSNTWDTLTRASWGASRDQSGKAALLRNNAYYEANYLPGMLGWVDFGGLSPTDAQSWLALGAGLNAGIGMMSLDSLPSAMLETIKQWETARNLGAFNDAQRAGFRDIGTYWTLRSAEQPETWMLQQIDRNGQPIGHPQSVHAPSPQLSPITARATHGRLYEAKPATNTPAVVAFKLTGTLPPGLRLNQDTGGIVGVPEQVGLYAFDITAIDRQQLPLATARYVINVLANEDAGEG